MSRDPLRVPDYLAHILEAIERIRRYTKEMDETGFRSSEMAQDAVIRNLEVIGYFKIDFGLVWKTIESDLPVLYRQVSALL